MSNFDRLNNELNVMISDIFGASSILSQPTINELMKKRNETISEMNNRSSSLSTTSTSAFTSPSVRMNAFISQQFNNSMSSKNGVYEPTDAEDFLIFYGDIPIEELLKKIEDLNSLRFSGIKSNLWRKIQPMRDWNSGSVKPEYKGWTWNQYSAKVECERKRHEEWLKEEERKELHYASEKRRISKQRGTWISTSPREYAKRIVEQEESVVKESCERNYFKLFKWSSFSKENMISVIAELLEKFDENKVYLGYHSIRCSSDELDVEIKFKEYKTFDRGYDDFTSDEFELRAYVYLEYKGCLSESITL